MTLSVAIKELMLKIIPKNVLLYKRKISSKKRLKPRTKLYFEVHLTEHCNIACKGCSNFSPLAEKEYLDINNYERDCIRLSELSRRKADEIKLMGGEPLLHPQLIDIIKITRKYFDLYYVNILTNGTLLLKQTDEFWETCCNYKAAIFVSYYPINIDVDAIKKQAEKFNVRIYFMNKSNYFRKDMLDLEGKQNINNNFKMCFKANSCVQLHDGKMYTCSVIPYIKHFNKYFNTNLIVTKDDYIDIYKVNRIEEILDFLCKPIPFCRYCNIKKSKLSGVKWEISQKNISEWT